MRGRSRRRVKQPATPPPIHPPTHPPTHPTTVVCKWGAALNERPGRRTDRRRRSKRTNKQTNKQTNKRTNRHEATFGNKRDVTLRPVMSVMAPITKAHREKWRGAAIKTIAAQKKASFFCFFRLRQPINVPQPTTDPLGRRLVFFVSWFLWRRWLGRNRWKTLFFLLKNGATKQ